MDVWLSGLDHGDEITWAVWVGDLNAYVFGHHDHGVSMNFLNELRTLLNAEVPAYQAVAVLWAARA